MGSLWESGWKGKTRRPGMESLPGGSISGLLFNRVSVMILVPVP